MLIPTLVVPWLDLTRPLLAEGLVMLVDGIAIVSFLLICQAKTAGDWRWRWRWGAIRLMTNDLQNEEVPFIADFAT